MDKIIHKEVIFANWLNLGLNEIFSIFLSWQQVTKYKQHTSANKHLCQMFKRSKLITNLFPLWALTEGMALGRKLTSLTQLPTAKRTSSLLVFQFI